MTYLWIKLTGRLFLDKTMPTNLNISCSAQYPDQDEDSKANLGEAGNRLEIHSRGES